MTIKFKTEIRDKEDKEFWTRCSNPGIFHVDIAALLLWVQIWLPKIITGHEDIKISRHENFPRMPTNKLQFQVFVRGRSTASECLGSRNRNTRSAGVIRQQSQASAQAPLGRRSRRGHPVPRESFRRPLRSLPRAPEGASSMGRFLPGCRFSVS